MTHCLPCSGELSSLRLCDKMSYLASRVSILSNTTYPAKCPKYSAPLSALEAGWMDALSLKGVKRREGKWKKKGLIPWAGQGQCKSDANEEASLQRERTTEGSSLVTVARLGV